MMRILFICNEYPPAKHGGIGVFVKNLAEQLVQHNFRCAAIGMYDVEQELQEEINSVTVIRCPFPQRSHFPLSTIASLKTAVNQKKILSSRIESLLAIEAFDIIESFDWSGPLYVKPSVKLVLRLHGSNTSHSDYEHQERSIFLSYWEKKNIKFADAIISVSKHMLQLTEHSFGKIACRKELIYNSIDATKFKQLEAVSRNPNQLLFVGKFHERKGVFELFEILNELLALDTNYQFLFVGNHTNENQKQLLSLVDAHLHQQIVFKKAIPQDELPQIYNQATLMLMPTKAEAFGLTTIEAMACGCVVALSNYATGPELVESGVNGVLIDIRYPRDVAEEVHSIMKDTKKIRSMREEAIKKVRNHFMNEVVLKQNIDFYKFVVSDVS